MGVPTVSPMSFHSSHEIIPFQSEFGRTLIIILQPLARFLLHGFFMNPYCYPVWSCMRTWHSCVPRRLSFWKTSSKKKPIYPRDGNRRSDSSLLALLFLVFLCSSCNNSESITGHKDDGHANIQKQHGSSFHRVSKMDHMKDEKTPTKSFCYIGVGSLSSALDEIHPRSQRHDGNKVRQ